MRRALALWDTASSRRNRRSETESRKPASAQRRGRRTLPSSCSIPSSMRTMDIRTEEGRENRRRADNDILSHLRIVGAARARVSHVALQELIFRSKTSVYLEYSVVLRRSFSSTSRGQGGAACGRKQGRT